MCESWFKITTCHNLESPEKRVSIEDCLVAYGIYVGDRTDCNRLSLWWVSPFPRQRVLNYIGQERGRGEQAGSKDTSVSFCFLLRT